MSLAPRSQVLGYAETAYVSLTAVIVDQVLKAADVRLLGLEPCGNERILVRLAAAETGAMNAAMDALELAAERLHCPHCHAVIAAPDEALPQLNQSPLVINPLYGGREEWQPNDYPSNTMKNNFKTSALGILETQGLTASLEATDSMLKTADVHLVGKEKIGAAYVTIMIAGDVAAVDAAIQAGKEAAKPLGKVIAAHVIARPHEDLVALLPG